MGWGQTHQQKHHARAPLSTPPMQNGYLGTMVPWNQGTMEAWCQNLVESHRPTFLYAGSGHPRDELLRNHFCGMECSLLGNIYFTELLGNICFTEPRRSKSTGLCSATLGPIINSALLALSLVLVLTFRLILGIYLN